jgi:anti-sigma B factor antagonist
MQSVTKSQVDQLKSPAGHSVTVLRFQGDITITSRNVVLGAFHMLPKDTTKLILLDFTKVGYFNSSGITLMIQLLREAYHSAQRIYVFGLSPHFTKIFTVAGITTYTKLFPSEEAAIGAL